MPWVASPHGLLWLGVWEAYGFETTEILDHGDHVIVIGIQTGRGRNSGVEAWLQTFNVITLREEKVTLRKEKVSFDDRAAALEAAGRSE